MAIKIEIKRENRPSAFLVEKQYKRDTDNNKQGDIFLALDDIQEVNTPAGELDEARTLPNVIAMIQHIGVGPVIGILNSLNNRLGQITSKQYTKADGTLDVDSIVSQHIERTTRTETKPELIEIRNNKTEEYQKLLDILEQDPSKAAEVIAKLQIVKKEVIALNKAIEAKTRERKSKDEQELEASPA